MRPGKARASPWQRGRNALARLASGSDVQKGAQDETMAQEAAGWPPEETLSLWKREQARLKARVVDRDTEAWQRDPAFSGLRRVGGVDVSFVKGDSVRACASLVVLSYPELEVLYEESRMVSLTAPYVSGFLAFREVPFLLELVQQLREKEPGLMPQVLLVDGNGVLHHRGFGVACHLGVLTDLPCVGVAKKLLQVDGLENNALHKEKIRLLQTRGDSFPLLGDSGTVLGMALRSHDRSTRPLYVSVGHRMSLEAAVRLTCCCCRFRIPEPVRQVGGPGIRGGSAGASASYHLLFRAPQQLSWGQSAVT
uniref:Endonuclease V n=1 Tax=Piliocolobus tephrosceles TaxID=591936 RepID=A0A8C9IL59_9PRIM